MYASSRDSSILVKDYYLFRTDRGNRYCYNIHSGHLLLCHPVLYEMISIHRQGGSVTEWHRESIHHSPPTVAGVDYPFDVVRYYLGKLERLRKSGFLSESTRSSTLDVRLTPEDIEMALNTTGTVSFEMTETCNLRCHYCCYGDHFMAAARRGGRHLDADSAVRLLEYLFARWNRPGSSQPLQCTIGFYGGEPLLRLPAIERIIMVARDLNAGTRPLRFKMTTNGVLLAQFSDFLAEHNVELLISLDGDEEAHAHRVLADGSESYTRVLEGIMTLKKRHPSYFDRCVDFIAVFTSNTSVERLYEFFTSRFGKIPIISPLSFLGARPNHLDTLREMQGDLQASLEHSNQRGKIEQAMFSRLPLPSAASQFLVRAWPGHIREFSDILSPSAATASLPTGTCVPFAKRLFLTVDGKILPCERIGAAMVLGQVAKHGVVIDCEDIARRYNEYYDRVTGLCQECHHRMTCSTCMFHLDLHERDFSCPEQLSDDQYGEYLARIFSYLESNQWIVPRVFDEVEIA